MSDPILHPYADDDLITVGVAAAIVKLDDRTTIRWADAGKLGAVTRTRGGHRRLRYGDVIVAAAERRAALEAALADAPEVPA